MIHRFKRLGGTVLGSALAGLLLAAPLSAFAQDAKPDTTATKPDHPQQKRQRNPAAKPANADKQAANPTAKQVATDQTQTKRDRRAKAPAQTPTQAPTPTPTQTQ